MSGDNRNEFSLEEILADDYGTGGDFSLESILAEYKGNAFLEGERKTPPDELDRKVNEIFREITGKDPGAPAPEAAKPAPKPITFAPEPKPDASAPKPGPITFAPAKPAPEPEPELPEPEPEAFDLPEPEESPDTDKHDIAEEFFANWTAPQYDDVDTKYFESREFADMVSEQLDRQDTWSPEEMELDYTDAADEDGGDDDTEEKPSLFARLFGRRDYGDEDDEDVPDEEEDEDYPFADFRYEEDEEEEEEEYSEPPVGDEIARFSAPVRSLTLRALAAGAVCALILLLTHLYGADRALPFGIGYNSAAASGAVVILQLVVMLLGLDVLISGIEKLVRVEPDSESLVVISCAVTVIDAMRMLVHRDFSAGLPFSLVSASSLLFALLSRRSEAIAMRDSLKTSVASASPYGVIPVSDTEGEREVLKKVQGASAGFYRKLMCEDIGGQAYFFATPLIIIASFVFALLASFGRGRGGSFAHCYAVIASAAAAFPAASVFVLPFRYAASWMKKSGCAIAGWVGACEIFDADSALITDEDVFPVGTVSLSGIKFFEGVNNQTALVDACSLLGKADTGISRIFTELLRSQGLFAKDVDSFDAYEGGGVGGVIDGERVLAGSGAFMNLMGIRVPDKVNVPNTVFTAINGELAAAFTLNYVPTNSIRSALQSLLGTKVGLLLAVKDFNVTPNVIAQKFRVSMEGVEQIPVEASYRLNAAADGDTEVSAILCREGLTPLADVITKGRLVKQVTEINTLISLGGTVIGMLLMFFLCWTGAFGSATAENAFVFMAAVGLCVLLLSQLVRKRQ